MQIQTLSFTLLEMTIPCGILHQMQWVCKLEIKIFGKNVIITVSSRRDKKYMIYDPNKDKYIHFGQMGYQDFTRHKDKDRRRNYWRRLPVITAKTFTWQKST